MATIADTRPRAPKTGRHGERRRSRLTLRSTLIGWSFILPNFLGFAALTLVPVVTPGVDGVVESTESPVDAVVSTASPTTAPKRPHACG